MDPWPCVRGREPTVYRRPGDKQLQRGRGEINTAFFMLEVMRDIRQESRHLLCLSLQDPHHGRVVVELRIIPSGEP